MITVRKKKKGEPTVEFAGYRFGKWDHARVKVKEWKSLSLIFTPMINGENDPRFKVAGKETIHPYDVPKLVGKIGIVKKSEHSRNLILKTEGDEFSFAPETMKALIDPKSVEFVEGHPPIKLRTTAMHEELQFFSDGVIKAGCKHFTSQDSFKIFQALAKVHGYDLM